ncbi:MAG: hypothetical protein AAFP90_11950 [Planctomycetota bacterium]
MPRSISSFLCLVLSVCLLTFALGGCDRAGQSDVLDVPEPTQEEMDQVDSQEEEEMMNDGDDEDENY